MSAPDVPVIVMTSDPYPTYEDWRATGPLVFDPDWNTWHVVGHQELAGLLRNPALIADRTDLFYAGMSEAAKSETEPLWRVHRAMMLFRDPPVHTRLRGLVNRAFTPRVVEVLREKVAATIDGLLDEVDAKGEMDVIADLAFPLPVIVIAELLGAPPEDRVELKAWSDAFAVFIGGGVVTDESALRANAAIVAARGYFQSIIDERKREPRPDLLSALLAASDRGDVLEDDELFATALLVLFAGHETTTNLIGNGVLALLSDRDAFGAIRVDPALTPAAVEEVLRYDSPVQVTGRMVAEPFAFGGERFDPGQSVDLWIGAANRDPRVFAEPDRFDIRRADNRHLAFGYGAHFCLGAPLARLEGQLTFAALAERFPNLRLAGGLTELHHHPGSVFRALRSLPVDW